VNGKAPDWTRTGTIVGYAEYLRKQSGALCVVVIRRDDAALVADPLLAPSDARELVDTRMVDLEFDLAAARREKRKGARVELGPLQE
jgi:hypothetical protein